MADSMATKYIINTAPAANYRKWRTVFL